MATATRGLGAFRTYLEMIKVEHSIFALPFAGVGLIWGARAAGRGWPSGWVTLWVVVAMVACRSAAMAYNRIADRDVDALNPRTRGRAIPAGLLTLGQASLFLWASVGIFLIAAAALNPLALALSPVALFVTLGYSRTKRFTPLSHFVLGLSLGIAPAAAWIAATGRLDAAILPIAAGVLFWTAGFDVIYSLQDVAFDREWGLRSLPETIGAAPSLWISRFCHVLAIGLLALGGAMVGAGSLYYVGLAVAAALLAYEQSLVRPDDLRRVNVAFFTLNGFVSLGVFAFALADLIFRDLG